MKKTKINNSKNTKVLIFKTDIKVNYKVKIIRHIFKQHRGIIRWTIDMDDVNNVLRIDATDDINEKDIILLLKSVGYHSKALII